MNEPPEACILSTPVGQLRIRTDGAAVIAVDWTEDDPAAAPSGLLAEAALQIDAYFAGRLRRFDLPLAPAGTEHDRAVWNAMCAIPFGDVRTYGAIAAEIGSAPRAVGTACGRNPIPVIIPCHRIVAAGRRLGGYSGRGGGATKQALLRLEGYPPGGQADLFTVGAPAVAGDRAAR